MKFVVVFLKIGTMIGKDNLFVYGVFVFVTVLMGFDTPTWTFHTCTSTSIFAVMG